MASPARSSLYAAADELGSLPGPMEPLYGVAELRATQEPSDTCMEPESHMPEVHNAQPTNTSEIFCVFVKFVDLLLRHTHVATRTMCPHCLASGQAHIGRATRIVINLCQKLQVQY